MNDPIAGEALIERRMDRSRELILARGRFDRLFSAYDSHVATWELPLDALGMVMMRQALGGVALYLSSRPRDESCAFTFNFAQPPMNIFVSGRSEEGSVTGRAFSQDVATTGENRLFVQMNRSGGRNFTSVIDVQGLDLLLILEDYSTRSDQAPFRLFELSDDEYLMVASLPREENEGLAGLDREEALRLFEGAKPLDEKRFSFHCGCDPNRMQDVVKAMFRGRFEEIFGGDPSVEISCPRCGRRWTLRRDQMERKDENS